MHFRNKTKNQSACSLKPYPALLILILPLQWTSNLCFSHCTSITFLKTIQTIQKSKWNPSTYPLPWNVNKWNFSKQMFDLLEENHIGKPSTLKAASREDSYFILFKGISFKVAPTWQEIVQINFLFYLLLKYKWQTEAYQKFKPAVDVSSFNH